MELLLNDDSLINLLKDLLSCPDTWIHRTIHDELRIKIDADLFKVQKAIYDYLNNPARKNGFERGYAQGLTFKDVYGD